MTEIKRKKVLWISGLSIASILVVGFIGMNFVPIVLAQTEAANWPVLPAAQNCGTGVAKIQHVDKIIFHTEGAGLKGLDEFGNLIMVGQNTPMDIIIADATRTPAVLPMKVADTLNLLNWNHLSGNDVKAGFIVIDDVEYSTYCTFQSIKPSTT